MTKRPFLTFRLHELLFAIDSMIVKEILWLPELTPAEEAPDYVAGLINYRGKIIPVTDLNRLFGHDHLRYNLSDSIIVIESAELPSKAKSGVGSLELPTAADRRGLSRADAGVESAELKEEVRDTLHEIRDTNPDIRLLGLLVNEVLDVVDLSSEDIEPSPFYSALSPQPSALETSRHHFIDAEAVVGEDIIMLLNHHKILDFGFGILDFNETAESGANQLYKNKWESKIQNPNSKIIEEFHERAVNLMQTVEEEGLAGLMPMAVVSLGGEYFGMDLELVREFSDIPDLTPIPCCPEHILGNMNLRGNVLTVIDIRDSLNLTGFEKSKIQNPKSKFEGKVIVAATGGLFAGIAVDNVFDVIYLNLLDIKPVPSAVRTNSEQYIKGTAPYNNKVMTILDLKKILEREELVVNEEV